MAATTRARRTTTGGRLGAESSTRPAASETVTSETATSGTPDSKGATSIPGSPRGLSAALLGVARVAAEALRAPVADSLLGRHPRWSSITLDEHVEEGTLVVEAELPGLTPDDITVAAEHGRLLLRAEQKARPASSGVRRRERRMGTLSRELPLPPGTDPTTITASYAEGLLTVRVPLPAPPARAQRVEIPVSHRL